jgi:hypothetical protein
MVKIFILQDDRLRMQGNPGDSGVRLKFTSVRLLNLRLASDMHRLLHRRHRHGHYFRIIRTENSRGARKTFRVNPEQPSGDQDYDTLNAWQNP